VTRDLAASVHGRLLHRARGKGVEFELFLVRYVCERFLYRLGASEHRDRCVLKGAALLSLWLEDPYRSTRDLDFLSHGPDDAESIRDLVTAICSVSCTEDAVRFDLDTLELSPIRSDEEYHGQRVVLRALLGKARVRLQADFGFGDAMGDGAVEAEYPTLLPGLAAPKLRTYPRELSLAEKFEAMVQLGRRNSRMKDFHDAWALSSALAFEGPALRRAVVECFDRRRTAWLNELPDVLGTAFYGDVGLAAYWNGYLRNGDFQTPPPSHFETIGERVRGFFGPLRACVVANDPFAMHWPPGGPWQ
jgi:predicted nucleotidyltransferase component of viral defense system